MLSEDQRINRIHARHREVAQKQGIQSSIHGYADVGGRLRTVRTRSVITPIGGVPIGIDQSKLEESLSVKGLPIDRDLSCIIESGRNRVTRADESKQTSKDSI